MRVDESEQDIMELLFFSFYKALLPLFRIILSLIGIFNTKVQRGLEGRKKLFDELEHSVSQLKSHQRVWIHVSSMGEFEQAKPIIRLLHERYPHCTIIVSFFSPSGYEHSQRSKLVDVVTYIPFDSIQNAKRFISILQPTVALFIRYDLWPHHILEIYRNNIPAFLVNATLPTNSKRLLPLVRQFHAILFNMLNGIYTVTEHDAFTFRQLQLSKPEIEKTGDTRYDQVWYRRNEAMQKHLIASHIIQNKRIIVAGSTWPEDEEVIIPALKQLLRKRNDILIIIVPHEPTEDALEMLERQCENGIRSIRFSDLNDYSGEEIILVDSIGILMPLYQYGTIAYVGGSFKQGIHNVLEPAVYGIPVLFGPKHTNSHEAQLLVQSGAAFVIQNTDTCLSTFELLLTNDAQRTKAGEQALTFVKDNIGATDKLFEKLKPYFL